MVVDKRKKYIVPVVLGLVYSLFYFVLPIKYFLVGFLGILGAMAVIYKFEIGLLAGLIILPFMPDLIVLLYMYFLVFAYFYIQFFRKASNFNKKPMDLPIVIFLVLIVLATITSINPKGSLRDLAIHLGGIGFLFVTVNTVDTKDKFNKLAVALTLAGSLVSLYGLYQYLVGVEMDAAWLDVANNPDIRARIYSVFYNPNILAEYLVMLIPISVGLFWYNKKLGKKVLFLGTSLLMSLALVLTLSRGGWLGFAFSAFVFVLLVEKRLLLSVIPLSLLGLYFLPQTIVNRILSIGNLSDSSNAYRLKIWSITGDIIRDNKAIGIGFGHLPFKQTFETYIRTMPARHAHNTFLELTAELGLIGLLVFLIFLFVTFKYGIKILNKSEDSYIKIMGAASISSLAGVLLHGSVESVLYMTKIIMTFWIMISLVYSLIRLESKNENN